MGRVSPHHPTRGLWQRRIKAPLAGSGAKPRPKMVLCIFEVRKKPSGSHPFQYFFSAGGPPNVAGPGKNFPPPPLDGSDQSRVEISDGRSTCPYFM